MEENEHAITVENLTKRYKTKRGIFTAVDNINFKIRKGKIYGLIGPNGAGKTTTIKMLVKLVKPTSGKISYCYKELNKILGYVPEKPVLYNEMRPIEYLTYLGKLSGIDKGEATKIAKHYFELFNLKESGNKKLATFSSGMKQKVLIAQALMHNPKLLILDEPTTALDPSGQAQLLEILKYLSTEKNVTILISSHHMEELERIIDYVLIFDKGKIILDSEIEELRKKTAEQLEIETTNPDKVAEIIRKKIKINNIVIIKNEIIVSSNKISDLRKEIVKIVVESGEEVISVHTVKKSLWSIVMEKLEK